MRSHAGAWEREKFLHVNDMAEASLFVLDLSKADYKANTSPMLSHINVGTGQDVTIAELAAMIAQLTGFISFPRSCVGMHIGLNNG